MTSDERELTRGLLSKDASFRLIVSGTVGVKEIERLIKKLEIDKEILADRDDEFVMVHNFVVWDNAKGEHVIQPQKSTIERIARVGGQIIPCSSETVSRASLDEDGRYSPKEGAN